MNWTLLIYQLLAAPGITLARIAREAGVTHESIRKLKIGATKTPKFTVGEKIFLMHFRHRPDLYIVGESPVEVIEEDEMEITSEGDEVD